MNYNKRDNETKPKGVHDDPAAVESEKEKCYHTAIVGQACILYSYNLLTIASYVINIAVSVNTDYTKLFPRPNFYILESMHIQYFTAHDYLLERVDIVEIASPC